MSTLTPETVFTAAICEAEIRYGLARLAHGRKRDELMARIATLFEIGFPDQVLRFDRACAAVYGEIRHVREAAGKPIAVEDAMIAATARAYGARAMGPGLAMTKKGYTASNETKTTGQQQQTLT